MAFADALERAVDLLRAAPAHERERVLVERALPLLLEAGSAEAFLAWCAEHRAHRLDLAEAAAEVCAKAPELAAQVLRIVADDRLASG